MIPFAFDNARSTDFNSRAALVKPLDKRRDVVYN
jgi:hypothetical protein